MYGCIGRSETGQRFPCLTLCSRFGNWELPSADGTGIQVLAVLAFPISGSRSALLTCTNMAMAGSITGQDGDYSYVGIVRFGACDYGYSGLYGTAGVGLG